jgi:cytochrome c oxidase subunit II
VGGTAILIGLAYAGVVVLALVATLAIALSTRSRRPVDTGRLAANEKRWLLVVVAFLLALLLSTIWFTPYGHTSASNAQVVNVTAQQFFWKLDPQRVKAKVPVEFRVRATDVNHGFGIYKGAEFVAQVQVVPDKTQTLVHTFGRPGTYTILCLEFCGLDHSKMTATFEVTR